MTDHGFVSTSRVNKSNPNEFYAWQWLCRCDTSQGGYCDQEAAMDGWKAHAAEARADRELVERVALAMAETENNADARMVMASHDPLGYQKLARAAIGILSGASPTDATTGAGAGPP